MHLRLYADSILSVLDDMRANAKCVFAELFATITTLCNLYRDTDVELVKPRLCKRQTARCNIPANTAEAYFKVSAFVPFIDNFCLQLKDRPLDHRIVLNFFFE